MVWQNLRLRPGAAYRVLTFGLWIVSVWAGLAGLSGMASGAPEAMPCSTAAASVPAENADRFSSLIRLQSGDAAGPVERQVIRVLGRAIDFCEQLWGVRLEQPIQLYICEDDDQLAAALSAVVQDPPDIARRMARFAAACVNDYRMFIKRSSLARMNAAQFSGIVCHETVHIFQRQQQLRGADPAAVPAPWLKEGYAELVSRLFVANRQLASFQTYRRDSYDIAAALAHSDPSVLPRLADIDATQWLAVAERIGAAYLYRCTAVAAAYLLRLSGDDHRRFAAYFAGHRPDGAAPFTAAFGLTAAEFQDRWERYLSSNHAGRTLSGDHQDPVWLY